jgi:phosphonopyruvate decarboxylase
MSTTESPAALLDRQIAVPRLLPDNDDMLIVAGLAGTARDTAGLCGDQSNYYALAGAMGGAVAMGLGLALAQPARRVVVITGDGELLMNVGSLATVAVMNPPNMAVLCIDNGRYGETGNQKSHTAFGVDLAGIAQSSGFQTVRTVVEEADLDEAAALLRGANGTTFVLCKVGDAPPPIFKRSLDGAYAKSRFRLGLLGHE